MLAWGAVIVFVMAAGRDLGWRIIDHRLVAGLLVLWGGHSALSGWGWETTLSHLGIGGLAFAVALAFYALGWIGGGDVKLAVPVFTWAGPQHGFGILVLVTAVGAALAVVGLAASLLLRQTLPAWLRRGLGLVSTDRGVPYGVALAFGGAAAALSAPAGAG